MAARAAGAKGREEERKRKRKRTEETGREGGTSRPGHSPVRGPVVSRDADAPRGGGGWHLGFPEGEAPTQVFGATGIRQLVPTGQARAVSLAAV